MNPVRLALLDRDGTINVKAPEGEYVTRVEELVLLPGAAQAIRRLNEANILTAVVTNQRCIARGLLDESGLAAIHDELRAQLAAEGATLGPILHCPHDHADACACRKPMPGMLLEAMAALGVRPEQAIMIGDADSDIEAGRRAGTATAQIAGLEKTPIADASTGTLLEIVDQIVGAR